MGWCSHLIFFKCLQWKGHYAVKKVLFFKHCYCYHLNTRNRKGPCQPQFSNTGQTPAIKSPWRQRDYTVFTSDTACLWYASIRSWQPSCCESSTCRAKYLAVLVATACLKAQNTTLLCSLSTTWTVWCDGTLITLVIMWMCHCLKNRNLDVKVTKTQRNTTMWLSYKGHCAPPD